MKKIVLSFTLIAALSAGCVKSDYGTEIKSAAAEFIPTLNSVLTKAIIDDSNITGEKIRIQVSRADGTTSYTNPADAKYSLTYSGGNWTLSDQLYLSTENATVYSYAPCPADPVTVESGSYSTLKRLLDVSNSQVMSSQVDYLWCTQNTTTKASGISINSSNPRIQLAMNHALSLVSFVIYKENYTGIGAISQFKISDLTASPGLTVNKTGTNDLTMQVSNGTITGGEKATSLTFTGVGNTITETSLVSVDPEQLKTKVNAYALIVPATIADKTKVQFSFTIDGKEYNVALTGVGSVSWEAGQQYIYKVKLSGTQLVVENLTVTPWTVNYSGEVIIN